MSAKPAAQPADLSLLAEITALLADPAQAENPLRAPLGALLELCNSQRQRLERLIRISDGYHSLTMHHNQSLAEQYDRQLRRLDKLARISDRYQNSLREMSESLKVASLRDPLTGMGNRRFLMERLSEETERASRSTHPYTIGILDIDYFKSVNDLYGHDIGDQVLCQIGHCIEDTVREYDLCGRWGGEEFLIILPETPLSLALEVAERVRSHIAQLHHDRLSKTVTASLGLSQYRPGESYSAAINRADNALLQAKKLGRNRIEPG